MKKIVISIFLGVFAPLIFVVSAYATDWYYNANGNAVTISNPDSCSTNQIFIELSKSNSSSQYFNSQFADTTDSISTTASAPWSVSTVHASPNTQYYIWVSCNGNNGPIWTENIGNFTTGTNNTNITPTPTPPEQAPVTTASITTQNSDGTYQNPVTVTLSATAASGYTVANIYYSIDAGIRQTYSSPFTITTGGNHQIAYWSVDSNGTTEQASVAFVPENSNISGRVYIDANQNGNFDNGEQIYSGATVSLSNGQTTTTDNNGIYHITNIETGNYTVTLTVPSGYQPSPFTTSNTIHIGLPGNNQNFLQNMNFGITRTSAADWYYNAINNALTLSNPNSCSTGQYNIIISTNNGSQYFNPQYADTVDEITTSASAPWSVSTVHATANTQYFIWLSCIGGANGNIWTNNTGSFTTGTDNTNTSPSPTPPEPAPITIANISPINSDGTYPDPTTVTLSATASIGHTVANTYYTIDAGSKQSYSSPFTITHGGYHQIAYWSIDENGVVESPNVASILVNTNIAGRLFVDPNQNLIQDTNESAFPGVTVTLNTGQTTTTDSNGNYEFTNIRASSSPVTITLTVPNGYLPDPFPNSYIYTVPSLPQPYPNNLLHMNYGIIQNTTGWSYNASASTLTIYNPASCNTGEYSILSTSNNTYNPPIYTYENAQFADLSDYLTTTVTPPIVASTAHATPGTPYYIFVTCVNNATAASWVNDIGNYTSGTDSSGGVTPTPEPSPVTTANLTTQYSDGTYSDPTNVTLTASAAAGYTVSNTYYIIDNNSTPQTYTTPFTVTGAGSHTITYWSVDNSGVQETHNTKTFTITEAITGNVFVDSNQNGVLDPGETGYNGGTTITLTSGQFSTSATTDSNGNYTFTGLPPATYTEQLTVPNGYTATTSNPVTVGLTTNTTVNFGIVHANTLVTAINAGGDIQGNFVTDTDFNGGSQYSSSATVDTSGISNPAPEAVYQTVRYGNSFSYTIPYLTANGTYTVRLHFNELYWGTALAGNSGGVGSRVFNVAINGTQVLSNYDIYDKAGGANKAVVEQIPATADSNGNITINFTTVTDNAMVNGIEVYNGTLPTPSPTPTPTPASSALINAGGNTSGNFTADNSYSGGSTYTTSTSVDTSNVTNPAPQAVYQSVRYGNFTYNVKNLSASTNYLVRLHFNELYWTSTGQRVFNVKINGNQVLTNFDIFQAAGGENKADVEDFIAPSDSNGKLAIQFISVTDNAMVSGIEIVPPTIPARTYYTANDGTNFSRSTSPFTTTAATQTVNADGSITINAANPSGYADSGFVLYEGTLGNLPNFTTLGTGDQNGLNIWFDTNNDNEYFAWDANNILTSLNGDTYGLTNGSQNGKENVNGTTNVFLISDGQNHTLSDLKNGAVSGINANTKVAVWVGVNTSNGSTSSTLQSINGL